jgi:hypothetical protein
MYFMIVHHIHAHIYSSTHTNTFIHTYTHPHTITHPHTFTHTFIHPHTVTHTHIYSSTHTQTLTHIHPHAHTYVRTTTYTHAHTNTVKNVEKSDQRISWFLSYVNSAHPKASLTKKSQVIKMLIFKIFSLEFIFSSLKCFTNNMVQF